MILIFFALTLTNSIAAASAELDLTNSNKDNFETFLTQYCVDCHGPDKEKGDIRLDQLSREFNSGIDSHLWAEVIEQINAGDMPPKKKKQPSLKEMSEFVTALDDRLKSGKAARMAARPLVAHYRLSREEYENTIYDLLGVRYDSRAPGQLNEDSLWHGYERIGSELTLSSSHVSRYLKAVNIIFDRVFPAEPLKTVKVRKTAADIRYYGGEKAKKHLAHYDIDRPLRYMIFPYMQHPREKADRAFTPEWFAKDGKVQPGLYRLRLQASGMSPAGEPFPNLNIGPKKPSGTIEGVIQLDITSPEDKPEIYEAEIFMENPTEFRFEVVAPHNYRVSKAEPRNQLSYKQNIFFTHSSETEHLSPISPIMFDDKGQALSPVVLLDWIEWEGPIETEAEQALRRNILPPEGSSEQEVTHYLQKFTERAWRRSVDLQELSSYLKVYRFEREAGETVASAFKVAMKGVLTSRHFFYLVEGEAEKRRDRLTDAELASRLSYFLWSSMPDDRLLETAKKGSFNGEGLVATVDRLLQDHKINRFIDDYPRQWLQLHKLGMFTPDKGMYPRYDSWLETSLRKEPVEFFREMFHKNLAVDNFIDSDWTVINARAGNFYGISDFKGSGFEKVALKKDSHRGGVLTMGAVLGMSSDGIRHRPVHRGVWVYEAIFNKTPPPPPANVDPIEPTPPKGEKLTIRQKLEAHSKDPSCSSCHQKLDPYGFAFDNFDAIGQWRTIEKVRGGVGKDPKVNATGELPDGRLFSNPSHFKQRLLEDRETFLQAFIEHLSTYALRRVLTVDDRDDIQALFSEAQKNNYGLKEIVRSIALSDLMRNR